MRAFLYILKSSPDPDRVERSVPFEIDEQEVFFGLLEAAEPACAATIAPASPQEDMLAAECD
ncbi:MAG TPA: hypothetical protein VNM90_02485 [Haliangium sp.]|nr:hypothetical protein [Haliangium sp.]